MSVVFHAVENENGIRDAVALWQRKFDASETQLSEKRLWGEFSNWKDKGDERTYYNLFGFSTDKGVENIVQINPPGSGKPSGRQGLVALDDGGSRWILHRGRMSVDHKQITSTYFAKHCGMDPVSVSYQDGETYECWRVANIDADSGVLFNQIDCFVRACEYVRHTFLEENYSNAKGSNGLRVPPENFDYSRKGTSVNEYFKRQESFRIYVLDRANGICELCEKPGPFVKPNGKRFLEVHHIISLCEDGADNISNMTALCPNCHREAHFGQKSKDIRKFLKNKFREQLLEDEPIL